MSRQALKSYFETNDEPTAEEIAELIDESLNLEDDSTGLTGNVTIKNPDHPMYGTVIPNCTDIVDFIKKVFIPFEIATVTINGGTSYIEKKSGTDILITGTIDPKDDLGLSNARIEVYNGATLVDTIAIDLNGITDYSEIYANVDESRSFITKVTADNDGSPGDISSATKSVIAVVPLLYGAYDAPVLNGSMYGNASTSLMIIPKPSQVVLTFDFDLKYIQVAFPSINTGGWGLPTEILDSNGFPLSYGPAGSGTDLEYVNIAFVNDKWTQYMYIFYKVGVTTLQGTLTFKF